MAVHALRIAAAIALVVVIALLPFLPGSYDPLAGPLSAMARVFGFVGLVLVPIGALWTASAYWRPRAGRPYAFAIAALIALSMAGGVLSLAALSFSGYSLGLATFALAIVVVVAIKRRLASFRTTPPDAVSACAVYLMVVPLAVFVLQLALVRPAVEFSRDRAIRNAAPLIADIERYRVERGRYPVSLLSVWKDYSPSVIGIDTYQYEPSGDAYNVLFEQPAADLATREIVVYNPRDAQQATGHAMDLLQYSPERLARSRGYFTVHTAGHEHWKYFWFD